MCEHVFFYTCPVKGKPLLLDTFCNWRVWSPSSTTGLWPLWYFVETDRLNEDMVPAPEAFSNNNKNLCFVVVELQEIVGHFRVIRAISKLLVWWSNSFRNTLSEDRIWGWLCPIISITLQN